MMTFACGRSAAILMTACLLANPLYAEDKGARLAVPKRIDVVGAAAEGKLFCSVCRDVRPMFSGVVTSIKVVVGQPVRKGQVLATYRLSLDSERGVRRELANAQLVAWETDAAEVEQRILLAADTHEEVRRLAADDLATKKHVERLGAKLKQLKTRHEALNDLIRVERMIGDNFRASLEERLGVKVDAASFPNEVGMVSPIDGYVVAIANDLKKDSSVMAYGQGIKIGVMDPMIMRVMVYETEARDLKVGSIADVHLPAIDNRPLTGKVVGISWIPESAELSEPSYYEVEISVPNPDLVLREGYRGRAVVRK